MEAEWTPQGLHVMRSTLKPSLLGRAVGYSNLWSDH